MAEYGPRNLRVGDPCAKCKKKAHDRAYYSANRERIREKQGAYAPDPDARRATLSRYREKHHEKLLAKARENLPAKRAHGRSYYAANKERWREWRVNNPEALKALKKRYRARRHNAPESSLTAEQWAAIVREYDGRCAYCFAPTVPTQDHVVALSKGGAHAARNVVPACQRCNSSKGNKPLVQWLWGTP